MSPATVNSGLFKTYEYPSATACICSKTQIYTFHCQVPLLLFKLKQVLYKRHIYIMVLRCLNLKLLLLLYSYLKFGKKGRHFMTLIIL